MRRRLARLLLVLALVPASACGGDDESTPSQGSTTTEPSPAETQRALEDTSLKPQIPRPTGTPPRRLEAEDIVKGKGRAAKPGDIV